MEGLWLEGREDTFFKKNVSPEGLGVVKHGRAVA
jgi:hypothetical protein